MKIVFLHTKGTPLFHSILEARPLGGTETGVVRLAEELQKLGHWVAVLSPIENSALSEVLYLPLHAMQDLGTVDLLIVIRDWQALHFPIKAKRRFLWTGDSYDQILNVGIGDPRVIKQIDRLLTVSDWHTQTLCEASGFPQEKAFNLGYGVRLALFQGGEQRVRKRLIYTSTPFRGLELLIPLMQELSPRHPDLELHVFSSFDVYKGAGVQDDTVARYAPVFDELRALRGVWLRGSVLQSVLARELMKASIFAYPNTFEETCCIAAMEAMAAGCALVSSAFGALPDTIGDAGVLLKERPGSTEYIAHFIRETEHLLIDDNACEALSRKSLERARVFDWSETAKRLLSLTN